MAEAPFPTQRDDGQRRARRVDRSGTRCSARGSNPAWREPISPNGMRRRSEKPATEKPTPSSRHGARRSGFANAGRWTFMRPSRTIRCFRQERRSIRGRRRCDQWHGSRDQCLYQGRSAIDPANQFLAAVKHHPIGQEFLPLRPPHPAPRCEDRTEPNIAVLPVRRYYTLCRSRARLKLPDRFAGVHGTFHQFDGYNP